MISFDVFDTVIARRGGEPECVFRAMAADKGLGLPHDWVSVRSSIRADAKHKTPFEDMYHRLASRYQWSDERRDAVMAAEIDAEMQTIIPVMCHEPSAKVVFISDMYLPQETIRKLIERAHGKAWSSDVNLHVTVAGKHDGWIWDRVRHLASHTGDNKWSDVTRPLRNPNGPRETHLYKHPVVPKTPLRQPMYEFIRECWLRCPYPVESSDAKLFRETVLYELPTLITLGKCLVQYLKSHPTIKQVFFTLRDSVYFAAFMRWVYPEAAPVQVFYSSRSVVWRSGGEVDPVYADYVRDTLGSDPSAVLVIDSHGSGKTWKRLMESTMSNPQSWYDRQLFFADLLAFASPHPTILPDMKHLHFEEHLLIAPGTLVGMVRGKDRSYQPLFGSNELATRPIAILAAHVAIKDALEHRTQADVSLPPAMSLDELVKYRAKLVDMGHTIAFDMHVMYHKRDYGVSSLAMDLYNDTMARLGLGDLVRDGGPPLNIVKNTDPEGSGMGGDPLAVQGERLVMLDMAGDDGNPQAHMAFKTAWSKVRPGGTLVVNFGDNAAQLNRESIQRLGSQWERGLTRTSPVLGQKYVRTKIFDGARDIVCLANKLVLIKNEGSHVEEVGWNRYAIEKHERAAEPGGGSSNTVFIGLFVGLLVVIVLGLASTVLSLPKRFRGARWRVAGLLTVLAISIAAIAVSSLYLDSLSTLDNDLDNAGDIVQNVLEKLTAPRSSWRTLSSYYPVVLHEFQRLVDSIIPVHHNYINQHFDVTLINLERSPARLEAMTKQFKRYGIAKFDRVDAVEGMKLSLENSTTMVDNKARRFTLPVDYTRKFKPGNKDRLCTFGCVLSHLLAIGTATGEKDLIVFEDDAGLGPLAIGDADLRKLVSSAPPDWTIIRLTNTRCCKKTPSNIWTRFDHIVRNNGDWSTAAYIVRASAVKEIKALTKNGTVMPLVPRSHIHADDYIYKLLDRRTTYNPPRTYILPVRKAPFTASSTIHQCHDNYHVNIAFAMLNRLLASA